jgi:hypothetical protein
VACEGEASAADREYCETQLMGEWKPVWILKVKTGDLRLVPHRWFGIVRGKGTGTLQWCFPNGRACSKVIEVKR